MKKCIISLISVFIVVLVLYVWYPDSHLMCRVVMENMPDDAEYIDMLISISKTDEEYTDFNEKNGEKTLLSPLRIFAYPTAVSAETSSTAGVASFTPTLR